METYFKTSEETQKAVERANKENKGTHINHSSFQCDCGESSSSNLIDDKTLDIISTFVYCECCYNEYE